MILPNTGSVAPLAGAPGGVLGEFMGARVIGDVQIPTTSGNGSQAYAIVGYSKDWLLYESPVHFSVNRDNLANQLSVTLVSNQYAALAVKHPSSICLVGPFSLTAPGS